MGLLDVTPEQDEYDAAAMAYGLELERQSPLSYFRFSSQAQADLARLLSGAEVYWRSANSGGKTFGAAHIVVAILEGHTHLDGVRLPDAPCPATCWVLTKSYRGQVDGPQQAILDALGAYPHEIAYANKNKNYIDTIWISTRRCQHATAEHCETCSRLVFHCEMSGTDSAAGGRIDLAWADEPPNEKVWREIRSRKKAGRRLFLMITATPLYRNEWEWLAKDFNAGAGRVVDGRVELRSTLYDNTALTDADRQELLNNWKNEVLFDARVSGEYIDTSGLCPFPSHFLNRWGARSVNPELVPVTVRSEVIEAEGGYKYEKRKVELDVWERPRKNESYWVICDPSTGIQDSSHDPAGMMVLSRKRKAVVAAYDGYLSAYGLGMLATKTARWFNRATIDVEMNGGYGRETVGVISRMKYPHISREEIARRNGKTTKRLGWMTNEMNRGEFVAAIQRALEEDSIYVPDAGTVSTLRGVIIDPNGKVLAQSGRHDEKMICLGRGLVKLATQPDYEIVERPKSGIAVAVRKELGRNVIEVDEEEEDDSMPGRRL